MGVLATGQQGVREREVPVAMPAMDEQGLEAWANPRFNSRYDEMMAAMRRLSPENVKRLVGVRGWLKEFFVYGAQAMQTDRRAGAH